LILLLSLPPLALAAGCGKSPPVSIFPLVSQEEIARGESLYNTSCRLCHGTPEQGNLPVFKPLMNEPSVSGDPLQLADAILFSKHHRHGPDGPYLFIDMNNEDVACVGNYLRSKTGTDQAPLRAKTVERAREIHDEQDKAEAAAPQ
jgi:mono/diheme cytochrome c family protein